MALMQAPVNLREPHTSTPSPYTEMPNPTVPNWQQTVTEKRRMRDEAIRKYSGSHQFQSSTANGTSVRATGIDQVDDVLQAISSGAVTATELCDAYIGR
jgi:amidase